MYIYMHLLCMQIGPAYGRKTMKGYLQSKGLLVGERQIGATLPDVNPPYHLQRLNLSEQHMNPIPYSAEYAGHKLHIDQNEKVVMFGLTHICAIDGFSGYIVGFTSMPIKNNVEIYDSMFKNILTNVGIWDTIRVDKGKEWVLSLFVQETLSDYRNNTSRVPHLQTASTQVCVHIHIYV